MKLFLSLTYEVDVNCTNGENLTAAQARHLANLATDAMQQLPAPKTIGEALVALETYAGMKDARFRPTGSTMKGFIVTDLRGFKTEEEAIEPAESQTESALK